MTQPPRAWWPAAAALLAAGALLAALPPARQGTAAKKPTGMTFVAYTADGKALRGALTKLGDGWAAELGQGRVAAGELVSLRQEGVPLPPLPSEPHLLLTTGDRVPFDGLRLDDEKLFFRHRDLNGGKEASVPLANVVLVWRLAPDRALVPEKARRQLAGGSRPRDIVRLRNGDTLEGTLSVLKGEVVEVEANKKASRARWSQVAAIAPSTELADRAMPKGAHARVAVTPAAAPPGGRFTLVSATCDGQELRGQTAFGATLAVPLSRVAGLDIYGGKATHLSALKPASYEYRPYLDEKWPWTAGSAVTGRDLRVGGSVYDEGVGMHAGAALTYALGGAYRRFEAVVGLDDLDGREGRVRVRVRVDGKAAELGQGVLRGGESLRVSVPVAGAKALALEVEALEDGPVQGVVNWAQARLVR